MMKNNVEDSAREQLEVVVRQHRALTPAAEVEHHGSMNLKLGVQIKADLHLEVLRRMKNLLFVLVVKVPKKKSIGKVDLNQQSALYPPKDLIVSRRNRGHHGVLEIGVIRKSVRPGGLLTEKARLDPIGTEADLEIRNGGGSIQALVPTLIEKGKIRRIPATVDILMTLNDLTDTAHLIGDGRNKSTRHQIEVSLLFMKT